jgi:hypothetical protein
MLPWRPPSIRCAAMPRQAGAGVLVLCLTTYGSAGITPCALRIQGRYSCQVDAYISAKKHGNPQMCNLGHFAAARARIFLIYPK